MKPGTLQLAIQVGLRLERHLGLRFVPRLGLQTRLQLKPGLTDGFAGWCASVCELCARKAGAQARNARAAAHVALSQLINMRPIHLAASMSGHHPLRGPIDTAGWTPYTETMSHHHHDAGHGHPARAASPSLLRLSAAERLAVALAIAGVLWAATWWVMS